MEPYTQYLVGAAIAFGISFVVALLFRLQKAHKVRQRLASMIQPDPIVVYSKRAKAEQARKKK